MTDRFKSLFSAALVVGGIGTTPLLSEDTAIIRFVDIGVGVCTIAKLPEGQLLFADRVDEDGYCLEAAKDTFRGSKTIDIVVFAGAETNEDAFVSAVSDNFEINQVMSPNTVRPYIKMSNHTKQVFLDANPDRRCAFEFNVLPQAIGETSLDIVLIGDANNTSGNFGLKIGYANIDTVLLGNVPQSNSQTPGMGCQGFDKIVGVSSMKEAQILQVPDGGSEDSISSCLIEAISPHFVIMSAGHGDGLPSSDAVAHYVAAGIEARNILRTDLGDGEGNGEWQDAFTLPDCVDQAGDDSITARLSKSGLIQIGYDKAFSKCWELADE